MKKLMTLAVIFLVITVCNTIKAALPVSEEWSGDLIISQESSLKIVLHFGEDQNGQYTVKLDSPEQGAYGLDGVVNYLSADSLNVSVPLFSINYAAGISHSAEGDWAIGTFRQGMLSLPLVMLPGAPHPNRPQTPQPPFPYNTRELKIENSDAGATLSGTLTVPDNAYEGTPLVILVSGSGQQNRDEEIYAHKPFEVLADYLARIGIASFRYDDRGFGESTGDASAATTFDLATDAAAVLDYLRHKEMFKKVGVLGHSEGASIAFILGNSDKAPDFIIGVGAPAVRGELILKDQFSHTFQGAALDNAVSQMKNVSPWMSYFFDYDPSADIAGTKCPVLVLYGEKDVQVSPKLNKAPMESLQPYATVIELPGLNHLMQHAATGQPDEYYKIEETIAPEALSEISRFIMKNK